jgi:hypothetical protein
MPKRRKFAERLRDLAEETGCDWLRLIPPADDERRLRASR